MTATALETRRKEDFSKIKAFCRESGGRVSLISADGEAPSSITLRLKCRTAGSDRYPASAVSVVELRIQIPAGYPFKSPPVATLSPIVYHPNVYASGQVCLGTKWIVSEYLDLLVKRVIRIITYQEDVLNLASPANREAAAWYRDTKSRIPSAFPTDSAETAAKSKSSGMTWKNLR